MNEPDVVRHYVNLSQLNYAVDTGFYPLGSCTMKFNPKLNEWAARLPGFANLHPMAPDEVAQGTLQLLWELERALAEISGMRAVTPPARGRRPGRADRDPDDPGASPGDRARPTATRCSSRTRATGRTRRPRRWPATGRSPSRRRRDGGVDVDAFRAALGPKTAAVMITNPSTLGLFEARIGELLDAVHAAGALAYMDGANLNAILGRFKPGEAGFDVMHFNVHKTFSTPHGGGGPGAGPVGVGETLIPYLPSPRVLREDDGTFRLERPGERPTSIGRLRSFVGNTGVLVRAYAYIRAHGGSGLREVSDDAVLAANYLKQRLADTYDIPYDRACKHEFVASAATIKKETGVRTLDIAKRLIDYGYHPPTIYFPLIVEEGMLIEPTETELVETLDAFADALIAIAGEAATVSGGRPGGPAHGPGPPPRRGHGSPPAEPPLAADERRGDAVSRLNSTVGRANRTIVRLEVDSASGAVDSTGSAPTRSVLMPLLAYRPFRAGGSIRRLGKRGGRREGGDRAAVAGVHRVSHPFGGESMQKRLFGILASIAVIAAACGGATTSSAPRRRRPLPGSPRHRPRRPPRASRTSPMSRSCKIDLGQEPPTLDPNKAQDSTSIAVLHALNRGLLYFDKDLKVVPELAHGAARRLGRRQDPDLHPQGRTQVQQRRPDRRR